MFKIVVHCGTLCDVYQGSSTLCLLHDVTIVYDYKETMSRHSQRFCKLEMCNGLYYYALPIDSVVFWKITMSYMISAKIFCKSMYKLYLTSWSSRLQARLVNTRWKNYTSLCAFWLPCSWRHGLLILFQFLRTFIWICFNNNFKATSHSTHFHPWKGSSTSSGFKKEVWVLSFSTLISSWYSHRPTENPLMSFGHGLFSCVIPTPLFKITIFWGERHSHRAVDLADLP